MLEIFFFDVLSLIYCEIFVKKLNNTPVVPFIKL